MTHTLKSPFRFADKLLNYFASLKFSISLLSFHMWSDGKFTDKVIY